MPEMNPDRLRILVDRLRNVIEEYGVKFDGFRLGVTVTQEYYDRIKNNFSSRSPSDIIFGVRKGNGHVDIIRSAIDLNNPPQDRQPLDWEAIESQVIRASMREPFSQFHQVEPKLGELDIEHRNMLAWTHLDGEHVIVLPQGQAVIREEVKDGITVYNAHIEDNSGNILTEHGYGRQDFEGANGYIHVNLIELDRASMDDKAFREKLAAALDVGINLFATARPTQVVHRLRLENIKRWVLHRWPSRDIEPEPTTDWDSYTFDWQKQDNRYHCQTPPGKAIIVEVFLDSGTNLGAMATYSILIEDETGVMLKDYYPPLPDFASAEARLREVLSDLDDPSIDELAVEYLSFTLRICGRLLPEDTDPMDFIRLRYVDNWLGEVLP